MAARIGVAGALLACLLVASAGLAWDISWHTYIGRDSFLTPPHAVLYGGVLLAGLTCLGGLALERMRGTPAPLGLLVTGAGLLTLVVSAPLDNYWHELYGVDVTLWAPFHVMGLVGGLVAVMGVVYAFAGTLAHGRRLTGEQPVLLALVLFAWSAALRGLLTILWPAMAQSTTTVIGPFEVLTLPVGLAFAVALVGAGAAEVGRPLPAAALTTAMAAAVAAAFAVAAPGVVRWAAAAGGYTFYTPDGPVFRPVDVMLPLSLVLPAAYLDAGRHLGLGGAAAGALAALPAALLGIWTVGHPAPGPAWLAVALAPAAGLAGGWLGAQLGTVWRLDGR